MLCVVLWATSQSPASMGSGHRNEKAWNTKCQRSGIGTGTYCTWRRLVDQLRPRYATEDDTFPGDDPNDDQVSALPHHEPKPPPKMAVTDNSVSSSGHHTSDAAVGPAHTEYGPESATFEKSTSSAEAIFC